MIFSSCYCQEWHGIIFRAKYCLVILSLTPFTQYRNPIVPSGFLQPPHNCLCDVNFQPTVLNFGLEPIYDVTWTDFPFRSVGSSEFRYNKRLDHWISVVEEFIDPQFGFLDITGWHLSIDIKIVAAGRLPVAAVFRFCGRIAKFFIIIGSLIFVPLITKLLEKLNVL